MKCDCGNVASYNMTSDNKSKLVCDDCKNAWESVDAYFLFKFEPIDDCKGIDEKA